MPAQAIHHPAQDAVFMTLDIDLYRADGIGQRVIREELIELHTWDVAGGRRGGEAYDGAVAAAYSACVFELDRPRRVRQRQLVDFETQAVEFKVRPGTRRGKGIGLKQQCMLNLLARRRVTNPTSHRRRSVYPAQGATA